MQINGKVRARVTVSADADREAVAAAALSEERVIAELSGRTPRKTVVVPGRLVNIVV